MVSARTNGPKLLAISDLHGAFPENRRIVENLRPESGADWLLVAGDVGELFSDIEWTFRTLTERFATVVWAPGNHELWTHPNGVRFEEVSLGHPREWQARNGHTYRPRLILPVP